MYYRTIGYIKYYKAEQDLTAASGESSSVPTSAWPILRPGPETLDPLNRLNPIIYHLIYIYIYVDKCTLTHVINLSNSQNSPGRFTR